MKEFVAILAPVSMVFAVTYVAFWMGSLHGSTQSYTNTAIIPLPMQAAVACPQAYTTGQCMTTSLPVMNGVDIVSYFGHGLFAGHLGSADNSASFADYAFLFSTKANRERFIADPDKYLPQYGGFCAWAVAGETDPSVHPWSADCLGPSGDPAVWEIIDGKLYFFRFEEARRNFMANPTYFIAAGDARWQGWFGAEEVFDTKCSAALQSV